MRDSIWHFKYLERLKIYLQYWLNDRLWKELWLPGGISGVEQRFGNPDRKGREDDPHCLDEITLGKRRTNLLPNSFLGYIVYQWWVIYLLIDYFRLSVKDEVDSSQQIMGIVKILICIMHTVWLRRFTRTK